MAAADAILAPDIQFHYPLGDLRGANAVKQYVEAVRTALPDIQFAVADRIAEGDRVAVRWSLAGTRTGEFQGNAPTGKNVRLPGITVLSIADGRIQEMWIACDPALLIDD